MKSLSTLNFILQILPSINHSHARSSSIYQYLDGLLKPAIDDLFGANSDCSADLVNIGNLCLPYFSMGTINSTHLFGLDELIIFSFYQKNIHRYKSVADLGANIGLHSISLSKLGFSVDSYEPDPEHLERIKLNIGLNNVTPNIIAAAVSIDDGETEFTRVVGNTTGSHLSGAKDEPYGELERFSVPTRAFKNILLEHELLKIDVEGHEANIICSSDPTDWTNSDAIVEVGSISNAERIFNHFRDSNIHLFAQSLSWQEVFSLSDMPSSYKDGSLFISSKGKMPW
ncbi:methyltransferase/ FkbM family domain protein [Synechococcus sp. PROS-9-1]|uniref:FkbM family methyltransferase n=1 Tax=Synechococcus sp. PROS-9-1 TaxID=1968775 RepID=UPI00164645C0|nr:FkbM family methyltransferase [Synechococcus sp. PROS-9-1]QNJ30607.1 methyltransferase/ FkbM family domain protein [Synechococcus sp. PROS-9-1]